jgi:hypothetical protein
LNEDWIIYRMVRSRRLLSLVLVAIGVGLGSNLGGKFPLVPGILFRHVVPCCASAQLLVHSRIWAWSFIRDEEALDRFKEERCTLARLREGRCRYGSEC